MKKQDELDLWNEVKDTEENNAIWWPKLFKKFNIPEKRGYFIIDKWNNKGILEYGVSLRTAWIEDKSKWKE